MHHSQVQVGKVRLHLVEEGRGPSIVLLHGFPEFWYSWRQQIPALAAAGFRVLAPDLRGYGESDRPREVSAYAAQHLVADIAGLIDRHAGGRAHVVGHDWGGVLAWRLAMLRPDLVNRLVVLNAPHPAAFGRVLRRSPRQWWRSLYMLWFQLPWLAEWSIQAGDFWLLRRAFQTQPYNSQAFTPDDIRRYTEALRRPGALTAALNYYLAALRYPADLNVPPQHISAPTLLLWGERDPYLGAELTEGLSEWVPNLRVERIPQASHWLQNDAPEIVNRCLLEFLAPQESPSATLQTQTKSTTRPDSPV